MIFTRQHECFAFILVDNRESPVAADIEKCVDVPCSVLDDEERVACHLIAGVFPRLIELVNVRNEDP